MCFLKINDGWHISSWVLKLLANLTQTRAESAVPSSMFYCGSVCFRILVQQVFMLTQKKMIIQCPAVQLVDFFTKPMRHRKQDASVLYIHLSGSVHYLDEMSLRWMYPSLLSGTCLKEELTLATGMVKPLIYSFILKSLASQVCTRSRAEIKAPLAVLFRRVAGAEHDTRFRPVVTSYDYDAPLSEAGDPTEKLFAIRDVIKLVLLINLPPAEVLVRLYLCIFLRCD